MPRKYAPYSAELADRLCVLIADGLSMRDMAALPGMPARWTLNRWMQRRSDFAARVRDARAGRAFAIRRIGPRDAPRRGPMPLYSEAIADRICERITQGWTTCQIAAEPGMPPVARLYKWLNCHPEFARMFAWACEARTDALADEVVEIADACEAEWRLVIGAADYQPGQAPTARDLLDRARLMIDARMKRFGPLTPKRYRVGRPGFER